jgi:hypothetical protein
MGWARKPRGAEELFAILSDTRDDELVALMTQIGGPGARIAWAEYGRRKFGVPYGIEAGQAIPYMLRDCGGIWS